MDNLKSEIQQQAHDLGFDDIGFVRAETNETAASGLKDFLAAGFHGDMAWMKTHAARRSSPSVLWPEAKSIIVLAMNYGPEDDPLKTLKQRDQANISVYARGRDYHDIIKKRLKRIARWLHQTHGAQVKVFVDTAPIMEKPLGALSGLGWQGKHTNLVSRKHGSWLFLGSIFTDLSFAPDKPGAKSCGTCTACLDICPTSAFPAPFKIDARRCISYLTIEHKGHIAEEFLKPIGNRIYGCDDCLAACPWNKFAAKTRETAFHAREALTAPLLKDLAGLNDQTFREFFSGSPIKRIGRDRFIRNVLIAIGNSKNIGLLASAKARLNDPSELVRAMAIWALAQLQP